MNIFMISLLGLSAFVFGYAGFTEWRKKRFCRSKWCFGVSGLMLLLPFLLIDTQVDVSEPLAKYSIKGVLLAVALAAIALCMWQRNWFVLSTPLFILSVLLLLIPLTLLPIAMALETANVSKFFAMMTDYVTIVGVIVAGGYFIVRLQFQKQFQRLTATVTAQRIDDSNILRIVCEIANGADVRINLTRLTYKRSYYYLTAGKLVRNRFRSKCFKRNLGVNEDGQSKLIYSIDAKSTGRFVAIVQVPVVATLVSIEVTFTPGLTVELYRVHDTFIV